jgi:hypothetical protein
MTLFGQQLLEVENFGFYEGRFLLHSDSVGNKHFSADTFMTSSSFYVVYSLIRLISCRKTNDPNCRDILGRGVGLRHVLVAITD